MRRLALMLVALAVPAAGVAGMVADMPVAGLDWRKVATAKDRERLRDWRPALLDGVARARAGGSGAAIDREGVLFEPDRALTDPVPPPGEYRCRIFKLGANGTAMTNFVAYPAQSCRIADEGKQQSFAITTGDQMTSGMLFPAEAGRAIYLGTLRMSDEMRPMNYGRDASRNQIGFVERIGAQRWRLLLPRPAFESVIDVIEIVPA